MCFPCPSHAQQMHGIWNFSMWPSLWAYFRHTIKAGVGIFSRVNIASLIAWKVETNTTYPWPNFENMEIINWISHLYLLIMHSFSWSNMTLNIVNKNIECFQKFFDLMSWADFQGCDPTSHYASQRQSIKWFKLHLEWCKLCYEIVIMEK